MCSTLRLAVLVAIVGCAELITVWTPKKHMDVKLGQNAQLECTFQTTEDTTSRLTFQWDFAASTSIEPNQILYYQSGELFIAEDYKDRIVPPATPATTKNVSVLLRNVQVTDSGLYTCGVRNLPDVEGTTEANIKVTVLQTPSKPYCSIHGNSHLGQTAILACHSEHGSPTPTYNWTRVGEVQTKTGVDGKPLSTGTLSIENITQSDYGTYRCTSTNVAGTSICELELHAGSTDQGTVDGTTAGYIAAVVVGVVLGCVLIGVSIWLIVRAVKNKKYKGVNQGEGTQMS